MSFKRIAYGIEQLMIIGTLTDTFGTVGHWDSPVGGYSAMGEYFTASSRLYMLYKCNSPRIYIGPANVQSSY